VKPGSLDLVFFAPGGTARGEEENFLQSLVAFRLAAESYRRHFAPVAPRLAKLGDGDPSGLCVVIQGLLKDFQGKPAIQLHSRRPKNGANGAGCPTLFADHFAKIAGGHAQFQYGDLFAGDLADHDLIRDVDQSLRDIFNQLFH
jgi:hypothetical protein